MCYLLFRKSQSHSHASNSELLWGLIENMKYSMDRISSCESDYMSITKKKNENKEYIPKSPYEAKEGTRETKEQNRL